MSVAAAGICGTDLHIWLGEYDSDPVYSARRLKELFVDICTADPGETWSGHERYLGQLKQRQEVQGVVRAAQGRDEEAERPEVGVDEVGRCLE